MLSNSNLGGNWVVARCDGPSECRCRPILKVLDCLFDGDGLQAGPSVFTEHDLFVGKPCDCVRAIEYAVRQSDRGGVCCDGCGHELCFLCLA